PLFLCLYLHVLIKDARLAKGDIAK
ncbi:MAG: hypothetical protein RJA63_2400, partial [Pseudomonadota bacterium]